MITTHLMVIVHVAYLLVPHCEGGLGRYVPSYIVHTVCFVIVGGQDDFAYNQTHFGKKTYKLSISMYIVNSYIAIPKSK